ncbi:flagellar protein FliT [Thioalkalivibrio sp.]|uniref:flagellar protein FliT n=1 Tax=Thioalkalivibrio sp. TaxID=2093813 RepID=UPI003976E03A
MSTEAAQTHLEDALRLVQEALAAAGSGEWERVSELDVRCREVSKAMGDELQGYDPRPLLPGLVRLRERHRHLLALAEGHRDELARASRESRRGRQGARAYEDNT